MINVSLTRENGQMCTHSPAEKAAAGAALVLYHAIAMVFAQDQQLDRVGGSHHFVFHDGTLAASQLSVNALRGHALSVCQGEDLPALWRLHATAAQRKFLSLLDS